MLQQITGQTVNQDTRTQASTHARAQQPAATTRPQSTVGTKKKDLSRTRIEDLITDKTNRKVAEDSDSSDRYSDSFILLFSFSKQEQYSILGKAIANSRKSIKLLTGTWVFSFSKLEILDFVAINVENKSHLQSVRSLNCVGLVWAQ